MLARNEASRSGLGGSPRLVLTAGRMCFAIIASSCSLAHALSTDPARPTSTAVTGLRACPRLTDRSTHPPIQARVARIAPLVRSWLQPDTSGGAVPRRRSHGISPRAYSTPPSLHPQPCCGSLRSSRCGGVTVSSAGREARARVRVVRAERSHL